MRRFLIMACLAVLLPAMAQAQQIVRFYHVSSGTGFFVNRQYVITNAHVVKGCKEVYIKGAVSERKAVVNVLDEANDLALLQTDESPNQFAPLRFNIDDLKAGDRVFVIGYPGEAGARGEFAFAPAQIEEMKEVTNMPGRFFITDVVEHGNSGGPVFDTSGNVIGVVVAKSTLYTVNAVTQEHLGEKHVGVVINLATLKQFLFDHGIFTEWMGSNLGYQDSYIEDTAKGYIVNVQCRSPETPGSAASDGASEPAGVNLDGR